MMNLLISLVAAATTTATAAPAPATGIDFSKGSYEIESLTDGSVKEVKKKEPPVRTTSEMVVRTSPGKTPGTITAEIVRSKMKITGLKNGIDQDYSKYFKGKTFEVKLRDGLPHSMVDKEAFVKSLADKNAPPEFVNLVSGMFRHDSVRVTRNLMDVNLIACAAKNGAKKSFRCELESEATPVVFSCKESGGKGRFDCSARQDLKEDGMKMEISGTVTTGTEASSKMKTLSRMSQPTPQGKIDLEVEGSASRKLMRK